MAVFGSHCEREEDVMTAIESQLAQPAELTDQLTQNQIDFYHANGYIGVDNVLSAEEIAELRRVTDELIEQARQFSAPTPVFDFEPGHTPTAPRVRRIKSPAANHPVYDRVMRH